ncbi:MAG: transglycosylase SLT domain-containing protein [Silicimonas sp.]|nr:transglycosylase SLT domain-containing protein [Silicimonas sp.]
MARILAVIFLIFWGGVAVAERGFGDGIRPPERPREIPRARWEHLPAGALWTRVTLSALESHGAPLLDVVPRDIAEWCPAYPDNPPEARAAFWTGFISTLARYESTWRPGAVGGGGRWFGLMQIYPPTAEYRGCWAQSGAGLKNAAANLNCAVRIMAITVPRDQAISLKDSRWRGVAADWGPMRKEWARADMQRYTSRQVYCRNLSTVRPEPRP